MNSLARKPGWVARTQEPSAALDALAQRLNDICRAATLDLTFRVGEFVIKNLFGGDSSRWDKDGARKRSYRALASRGDLPLSASALCRAVGVYVLVEQLGGPERWLHLTASHFQEVLPIAAEKRTALLLGAETGRWSVARLRAEANLCKDAPGETPSPSVVRSLRSVVLGLTRHHDALSRIEAEALHGDSRATLHNAIQAIHLALTHLEDLTTFETEGHATRSKSDISELGESTRAVPERT